MPGWRALRIELGGPMDTFFESLSGNLNVEAIKEHGANWVYGASIFQAGKAFICMARTDEEKFLLE